MIKKKLCTIKNILINYYFSKEKSRQIFPWYLTWKIVFNFTLLTINFMICYVRLFTKKAEWYVTQHRNECKRLQRWIAGLSNFPNGLSNRLLPIESPVFNNVLRNHPHPVYERISSEEFKITVYICTLYMAHVQFTKLFSLRILIFGQKHF